MVEMQPLAPFHKVHVSNAIDVEIVHAATQSVEIVSSPSTRKLVKLAVHDDTLHIEMERGVHHHNTVVIRIATPTLTEVELSGAAEAKIEDLHAESLTLSLHGASEMRASGNVGKLEVSAHGASEVDLEELLASDANVTATGASDIDISVQNTLRVRASGASDIVYRGDPKILQQSTSGASDLRHVSE